MKKTDKIRRYKSFNDDFETTKGQSRDVPQDYKWIKTNIFEKALSSLLYALAVVFSFFYCKLALHMKIENSRALKDAKKCGAFIYSNHTQPIGDVFMPVVSLFPNRIYTVVSPANLALPFIGRLLPYLGALPIPRSYRRLPDFTGAVEKRVKSGHCVIIYPEAHVWEYYTEIRPFSPVSFSYPVKMEKAVYSLTVTYQKRGKNEKKRPRTVIYADGPFLPDYSLPPRERAAALRDAVFEKMTERSLNSNIEYIKYIKE